MFVQPPIKAYHCIQLCPSFFCVECIIGYTLTEKVSLNVGLGSFERRSQESKVYNQPTDPVLVVSLLKRQVDLIQSLTEKVNRLSEASEKQEDKILFLSLKEMYMFSGV